MGRAIEHPSVKVPMLTGWRGLYDHVFVALHPFYRVPVEGARSKAGTARTEDTDGWQRDRTFEVAVKSRAEAVAWSEVHQAVAPEEPRDRMYRAIRLLACSGLRNAPA